MNAVANGDGEPILDQAEISAILGDAAAAAGDGGLRRVVEAGLVAYERLPMLEIVFDRLVRALSGSLRNFTSDNVDVALQGMASLRFGDYLGGVPQPAMLAVFKVEEWDNYGLLVADSALIYSMVDVLLGGRRGTAAMRVGARPYTSIERALVERLVAVVLEDLSEAFRPVSPARFRFERLEANPRFAAISRPANACVLSRFRIDMDDRGGELALLLPYATLEPVREALLQQFMGEKLGRDAIWEGHLATEIWQADVAVEAVLQEIRMPLKKVLSLEVGDTLMFDTRPTELVTLRCGEWTLTQGRIGRIDDRIAVQVARPLRRSRTTFAAFEASVKNQKDG